MNPTQPNHTQTVSKTSSQSISDHDLVYAGFWIRFLASLIDVIIVNIVVGIFIFITTILKSIVSGINSININFAVNSSLSLINLIISLVGSIVPITLGLLYYIYFIGKKGQTWGKKALHLKVINPDNGMPIGLTGAFLREIIGKFVSSFLFCLGYLWMLWDGKKQTWHDKIAHSIVIKTE
jgi:uncharacterized RDD family membrane protein YckC